MRPNELFDVSVVFDGVAAAKAAYRRAFGGTTETAEFEFGELVGLAVVNQQPLPEAELDLRFWPSGQPLGSASVALRLGAMDAFTLARMTGKQDQFGPSGRLREASKLVAAFLAEGGRAVVLHKAAAVVKSAGRFLDA